MLSKGKAVLLPSGTKSAVGRNFSGKKLAFFETGDKALIITLVNSKCELIVKNQEFLYYRF